jgi:hypothetical protein
MKHWNNYSPRSPPIETIGNVGGIGNGRDFESRNDIGPTCAAKATLQTGLLGDAIWQRFSWL